MRMPIKSVYMHGRKEHMRVDRASIYGAKEYADTPQHVLARSELLAVRCVCVRSCLMFGVMLIGLRVVIIFRVACTLIQAVH